MGNGMTDRPFRWLRAGRQDRLDCWARVSSQRDFLAIKKYGYWRWKDVGNDMHKNPSENYGDGTGKSLFLTVSSAYQYYVAALTPRNG
jgi:hypothetical protein